MRASWPLAMIPVGAKGESAPELAPVATITVMRKALIPASPAMLIAMGASIAVAAMLPGPMEASTIARKKNTSGMIPGFLRASRTLRFAI